MEAVKDPKNTKIWTIHKTWQSTKSIEIIVNEYQKWLLNKLTKSSLLGTGTLSMWQCLTSSTLPPKVSHNAEMDKSDIQPKLLIQFKTKTKLWKWLLFEKSAAFPCAVKLAFAVTSIEQPFNFKGHLFHSSVFKLLLWMLLRSFTFEQNK